MSESEAKSTSSNTEFRVGMTCEGCSNAVKRILGRMEGVTNVDTNVAEKRVVVSGSADPAAMLEALNKWAAASKKEVTLIGTTPAA